jgi:hypothetical protein
LRWSRLGLGYGFAAASAVIAVPVSVAISRCGPAFSSALPFPATLTLNSTAAPVALRTTLMTPATAATRARTTARRSLPLSSLNRAHERHRRDDDYCCGEEMVDAHT